MKFRKAIKITSIDGKTSILFTNNCVKIFQENNIITAFAYCERITNFPTEHQNHCTIEVNGTLLTASFLMSDYVVLIQDIL